MLVSRFILTLCGVCAATVTLKDPADYADLRADASDNALKAIYNITPRSEEHTSELQSRP